MRIYAVADIHNRVGRVSMMREIIEQHEPDMVVIAGDLTSYFKQKSVWPDLNDLPIQVLMVRGNSDFRNVDNMVDQYGNLKSLHLNWVASNGFRFIGLNGTIPLPFYSMIGWNEKNKLAKIASFVDNMTIVVAHPPPRGLLDRVMGRFHAGSVQLRWFLIKAQPLLYLCGHIHEDTGLGLIGKTVVINCSIGDSGSGVLIDIEGNCIRKVCML